VEPPKRSQALKSVNEKRMEGGGVGGMVMLSCIQKKSMDDFNKSQCLILKNTIFV